MGRANTGVFSYTKNFIYSIDKNLTKCQKSASKKMFGSYTNKTFKGPSNEEPRLLFTENSLLVTYVIALY